MATTYATLRMNGVEYVLVPKAEFRRLTQDDRRDTRKAAQAAAQHRAAKLPTISHEELKRSLGL
ncbi:MAG: hypothetical protein ACHRHE_14955 [Tepidisphaerales bacterium]